MIKEKAKFLAETNKLLQGVGSSEKILTEEEKQASVEYKLGSLFNRLKSGAKKAEPPQQTKKVDTNSFIYFKNKRELDIYKKSLQKNDAAIVKLIFSGKFSQVRRLWLKRRLLLQNIQIIENRLENKAVSYTKIAHGIDYYVESFFAGINTLGTILSIGLFLYVALYVLFTTLSGLGILEVHMTGKSILFLTFFSIFILAINISRGWKSMVFMVPVIFFLISFLSFNF